MVAEQFFHVTRVYGLLYPVLTLGDHTFDTSILSFLFPNGGGRLIPFLTLILSDCYMSKGYITVHSPDFLNLKITQGTT